MALIACAISVSACIAEASLITMTFDIEVLSNNSSLSVNGQEIQQFELLEYSVTYNTDAPGFAFGNNPGFGLYFGDVVSGGSLSYNGDDIATHLDTGGQVLLYNNLGRRNTDLVRTRGNFVNADGTILTVDTGSGQTSLDNFSPARIETEFRSQFFSTGVDLISTTDLEGALNDLNALLASELNSLDDDDRSFNITWSGGGGGGGNPSLSGRVVDIQLTVVPEPQTYALMAVLLIGLLVWRRKRNQIQKTAGEESAVS